MGIRKGRWLPPAMGAGLVLGWLGPVFWGTALPEETFVPARLEVPEGFEVELVAGPPLVHHPVMAGFDPEGRLFVAETAGQNLRDEELEELLPNFVRVLEDTSGDGRFDRSTVFAEGMTFPQGALWHDGALYVASPPALWRLEDSDGDGVADRRIEIASGFEYTGNAADVHGPFLSPTGRLFWCHGRKGHEVYQKAGELVSKGRGARIWSVNPDGSEIEVYGGGGMDNPVEVTFTEEGEVLGTVNLFYGQPRGDAVVHWIYGGVYPRRDQEGVLAEFKKTGELLSPVLNIGHVAPSGIMRYRSGHLGEEYRDNFFYAEFNTQRVMRVILERDGATFRGRSEAFVSSADRDVHFTDVLEDTDGGLLVVDTGGWFRIGCPTSRVAKPNIYGAIYRIRRKDGETPRDPRGLEIAWSQASVEDLALLLDDERFTVRDRAVEEIVAKGEPALPVLREVLENGGRRARLNAIWAATRVGSEEARKLVRQALSDGDAGVRQAACRSVAATGDRQAVRALTRRLRDESLAVRRTAAKALGRLGDAAAVPELLAGMETGQPLDRVLEHSLIYAAIEIDHPSSTVPILASPDRRMQKGALIALDQMDSARLEASMVIPFLEVSDADLRSAALDVVSRRSGWSRQVAALLERWIEGGNPTAGRREMLPVLLKSFLRDEAVQALVGRVLSLESTPAGLRLSLLEAIGGAEAISFHPAWEAPLRKGLQDPEPQIVSASIRAVEALKTTRFDGELRRIGGDSRRPSLLRVKALQAVSRQGVLEEEPFRLLFERLDSAPSVPERTQAARMLARSELNDEQLLELGPLLKKMGPLELQAFLPALRRSQDGRVGRVLVEALSESPAFFSLSANDVRRSFSHYPPEVQRAADPLEGNLIEYQNVRESRLGELEGRLARGEPQRGRILFEEGRGTCIVCHRIGDRGGTVGPDLSRIGRIRTGRDLLEAILYPSQTGFARGYEAYNVTTTDGRLHFGTLPRETEEAIYLTPVAGPPVVIPRESIRSIEPSPLSLMPPGLDRLFSDGEFADLVAYLQSLK